MNVVGKVVFSGFFSFLITIYIVPIMCSIAKRFSIVDVPDGIVKQHKLPTPYLGGLAVYCGFLAGIALTMPLESELFLFMVGITLLLMLGLLDDLYVLNSGQKLFGQFLVSLSFLKGGLYLKEHFFANLLREYFFTNLWSIPLSLLWILTVVNGFNLIDVMDGLASVVGIGISLCLLCIAIGVNKVSVIFY